MKIVALSDSPMRSGFGRIANEVFARLVARGHQVHVVSILWDGIAVERGDWYSPFKHPYPFQISGCAGRDIFSYVANIVQLANPDVVMSIQDFPYAVNVFYNCHIDWSRRSFVVITPIDGEPIAAEWLRLVDDADGTMVISEFGVQAMRRAGRAVELCPPGINPRDFYPATSDERQALRAKAGIPNDAFVLGMMAMNQGRKDIPHTLDGFAEFALDKPGARLVLDMDKVSPAGWNIPELVKTKNIPPEKILYKEDLIKRGLVNLRDRYVLLDAHAVLAHREGFGLPLLESQACRIPTIAMDWCSGTEICGGGKGYLVRRLSQPRNSTWGNALDYDPEVAHFVEILEQIHRNPIQAQAVADCGYQWAIARTWETAADKVEHLLERVFERKEKHHESGQCDRAGVQSTPDSPETLTQPAPTPADDSARSHPDG